VLSGIKKRLTPVRKFLGFALISFGRISIKISKDRVILSR